jgi:hypothetical protein
MVSRDFVPIQISSAKLTPQGDPRAYSKLDTPSGAPFDLVPPGHTDSVKGSMVMFCGSTNKSISRMILTFLADACIVGGSLVCPEAWWKQQRTQEDVLQELKDAFPRVPTVWLEEFAASCCTAAKPVQR